MRRWMRLAATLAALVLPAACAGVPSGSEPVAVRHVGHVDVGGNLGDTTQVVPPGPSPHMSSRDVVDGFLRASSIEMDARHQVARQFLTPQAASSWQDSAQATVYSQPLVDDQPGGGSVVVTAQRIATIAADGSYQANRSRIVISFTLKKVKGEWRIEDPPAGIYVRQSDFSQNFRSADVYFLSPGGNTVVPDQRYFEVPATAMPNRLIQALLAGPSTWLAPAVMTDIPANAALRNNVVDDSPTVTVDLSNLGPMSKSQLKGMSAQIVFTLAKFSSTSVRILSNGQPLAVPGVHTDQQLPDWQSYDAEALPASAPLYFVHGGSAFTGDGKPARGPAGKDYYELSSVAVPADDTKMAGVSHRDGADKLFVGPVGGTLASRFSAHTLTPPTWGGQSAEVWTVSNGSDVIRVPSEGPGQAQIIASPEVSKVAPVTQLRLSRDGTRVALIGRGGKLYIGRVSRGDDTLTIDGLRDLSPSQHGFSDVAWAGGDQVLALAPNSTASQVPWEIATDGSSRRADVIDTLPAPPTGIAAASDRLTVVSSKGELWYYDRASWTRVTANGSNKVLHGAAPVYPD